jgi:hypothetical protein
VDTFLSYKRFAYLKLMLIVLAVAITLYVIDNPVGGRNGGTVLGYSYGILAALGMAILMWYGIRKRAYYSAKTTLKGVLSFHVWLGVALIVLVPLHAGFSFGCNVHTLAYVLMVLCIISGIWGAVQFSTLAQEIGAHRGQGTIKQLLEQLELLAMDLKRVSQGKGEQIQRLIKKLDITPSQSLRQVFGKPPARTVDSNRAAASMTGVSATDRETALKVIDLIDRRMDLHFKLNREVRTAFWLKLWLFFHLPLACGAMALLIVHIISVFYNW